MPGWLSAQTTKLKVAATLSLIFFIAMLSVAAKIGVNHGKVALTFMISFAGIAFGWVIGIFATPVDPSESKKFSQFSKTISAFISGYLVSKIDKVFESAFDKELFFQEVFVTRVIIFLAFLVFTSIVVYFYRDYAG